MQPKLHIIGGPNGAGKTTFAKEYLPNELNCFRFYNSDEIAAGISPFDASKAQMQAGRILLRNLEKSLLAKESFALESTLSGQTYIRYLKQAKSLGYEIYLHYLWLPSAEESWLRVQNRVLEGGHAVPEIDVFRRFPRIRENIINSYAPLADQWYIWDASRTPADFISQNGKYPISYYI